MLILALNLQQAVSDEIFLRHPVPVEKVVTSVSASCGVHVLEVEFSNGIKSTQKGVVRKFEIDGREVPGAKYALQRLAGGRYIQAITFMNCGAPGSNFEANVLIYFSALESKRRAAEEFVSFTVSSEGVRFMRPPSQSR
ncbi:hypothetical protein [Sphingomonas hengshuiensis]|uniref:hypothetical protein n=1 Tax=Sphingomonas hengshuiensis TaxID=1609977 RepID=UPI0012B9FD11|nr:hypothetical protein [Sphingomonas hengshuiensis]